ncbi:metal ABC transporter permease [Candidatus Paracaedibacter symbiosus]|uniref:metal ABC transporter permease n=1 Tax=Candidatus Paracaedibacter symbiosus TaxID=244582 RepID=UPI0005096552|nr:metal ABC transporter permease [Candidatus Paracaedibacter symbiosus]
MYDVFIAPFVEFIFMRRALVACIAIALSCGPLGVLLVLRRMSLMGDALSHAILPGIAIGYLVTGLWLPGLSLGGLAAGLIVAFASGKTARKTVLAEDASFTGFYIISLALGVLILSVKGGNMNLTHFLFGSVLAVDQEILLLIAIITTMTLVILALIYRPLIYECFDPQYVQLMGINAGRYQLIFLGLVVINLVGACQALGTLMALGIIMLPAIAARLLTKQVWTAVLAAVLIASISGYLGLVTSYQLNWPSGPTIILFCGSAYLLSLGFYCINRVPFKKSCIKR